MNKKVSFKLAQLMSCTVALSMPMIASGVVNADNTSNVQNVSYNKKETKITFDPNDSLVKKALDKVHQGIVKKVELVTINNGKKSSKVMDKNKDGVYSATLNGNQSSTKYQYAVTFDDGQTYTINNPYAQNDRNELYTAVKADANSQGKTNITITTPDGTVIDINGSTTSGKDSNNVSVVSSSKISTSQSDASASSSSTKPNAAVIETSVSESSSTVKNSESKNDTQKSNLQVSSSSIKSNAAVVQGSKNSEGSLNHQSGAVSSDGNEAITSVKATNNADGNLAGANDNGVKAEKTTDNTKQNGKPAVTQKNTDNGSANTNANNSEDSSTSSSSSSSSVSSMSSSLDMSSQSSESQDSGSMPQTGEMILRGLGIIGIAALACVGGYYGFQAYKKKTNK